MTTTYRDPAATYRSAITYRGTSTVVGTGLPTDADEFTDSRWWTVDGDPVYPTWPDLKFEFAFGTGPFDPAIALDESIWTDVTSWVHATSGCTISRGRSSEFDDPQAGECWFTIRDLDRTFDPLNDNSPYHFSLRPRTPVRVSARYQSTVYRLFVGFVQGFPQTYVQGDNVTFIQITALDAISMLAGQRFMAGRPAIANDPVYGLLDTNNLLSGQLPVLPEERSGHRMYRLLSAFGFADEQLLVDHGQSTLRAGAPASDDLLDHLVHVAQTEVGRLFVRADGVIRFQERHYPVTEPEALFLDQAGWAFCYQSLQLDPYDLTAVRNEITRGNGVDDPVTAKDAWSTDQFGTLADEQTSLLFRSREEARDQAVYLLSQHSVPRTRVQSMTIKPARYPQFLWPAVLGWELGTRLVVGRTPLGIGAPFVQTVELERITHEFSSSDWTTTYFLTQPDLETYFRADSLTDGVLDADLPVAY